MTTESIIAEIRPLFDKFHTAYGKFMPKAKDFANTFCSRFLDWQEALPESERKDNGTQIGFIRAIRSEVSDDRDKYRTDPVYMTAQYLFRIGMKALKSEAKKALDSGTATPRQKKLAVAKGRKAKTDSSTSAQGVKIPLVTLLKIIADCKVSPVVFNAAVALSGLKPDVQKALVASFLDAHKALEDAA